MLIRITRHLYSGPMNSDAFELNRHDRSHEQRGLAVLLLFQALHLKVEKNTLLVTKVATVEIAVLY